MRIAAVALGTIALLALTACEKKPQPTPMEDSHAMASPPPANYSSPPPSREAPADDPYVRMAAEMDAMRSNPSTENGASAPPRSSHPDESDRPLKAPTRSSKSSKASSGASSSGKTYVVKSGDTLSSIAKQVYGDASKWRKIWDANKARVPNKDKLKVGTKLIIP